MNKKTRLYDEVYENDVRNMLCVLHIGEKFRPFICAGFAVFKGDSGTCPLLVSVCLRVITAGIQLSEIRCAISKENESVEWME